MSNVFGKNNPNWRGDKVGYNQLHTWVKPRLKKPKRCPVCHKRKKLELANKGIYDRQLKHWEWLCRKCHMLKDGRSEAWANEGRKRKIKRIFIFCQTCKKPIEIQETKIRKFCNHKCYAKYRKGKTRPFWGNQYTKKKI
jgi:hypothetical protein